MVTFPDLRGIASVFATLAIVWLLAFNSPVTRADEPAPNTKANACLQLNRIAQTRVVDNKTVLFYYSQNEIYRNDLPHACDALLTDRAFKYKTSINQICSVDFITPLISTGGSLMPAGGCGLGAFSRIDKIAAEKLLTDAKAARSANK